jgi:hypothetical protein
VNKTIPHQELTYKIIGAAMAVYNELGPGYKEEIYQKALSILFKGTQVGLHYLDFLVEDKVVVEIKALSNLDNFCEAQVISYLKASGCEVGLLINFGEGKLIYKRILPPKKIKGSTDETD